MGRFLGVVVEPAYVQVEGLGQVFDNLERVGTQAIGLWPHLMQPATPETGARVPDLHIDGYKRLLARPLWGRRELYVKSFAAYEPDVVLYGNGPYRPPPAAPADLDRAIPQTMVAEAQRRGMQTYLGTGPFTPPGLRGEDQPVRVDGRPVQPPYVARLACLNSLEAQQYALASIADLVQNYPQAKGLILDWVEFGAYRLEDHFTCFCPHCEGRARAGGFDWPRIRRAVAALWDWLHALTPAELCRASSLWGSASRLVELLTAYPGWVDFLRFKAESVAAFYRRVRALLDDRGRPDMALVARGWCPPWNRSSGSDYRALAGVCGAVSPKLFTFDHAVLPRWWAETLLEWNPALAEADALDAVVEWLDLPDDRAPRRLDQYTIPAPDEPHPARLETYRARLREVADQVGGRAACYPIAHPYLPDRQWAEMLRLIRESDVDGLWVNMYGYLSDAKLEILRTEWT
jgi:hypothetical protein